MGFNNVLLLLAIIPVLFFTPRRTPWVWGSPDKLYLRHHNYRLLQQEKQKQQVLNRGSPPSRTLGYSGGSSNTIIVDVAGDGGDFTDEVQEDTSMERQYILNERDWNIQVDTGGPFIGPAVSVEPRQILDNPEVRVKSHSNDSFSWEDLEVTKRIIGGYEADPHPFHSMLLLRYGGGWRWAGCGGTLISNCHVLTAAHCTVDPSKPLGAVFVNAHRPYQDNLGLPFHFSDVEHITRHAGFNSTTNQNDIAVIKMEDCLNVTEFPPAIPANPGMSVPSELLADILGFGKLSEQGSLFFNVESLQRAQVPIIPQQSCRQYYGDRVKEDMFCGGFAEGGVDACQGDSGSSMTFEQEQDGSTVILGVISWGVGCGRSHSPGVYASVQYHYDWIARQVCSQPESNNATEWCHERVFQQTTESPSLSQDSSETEEAGNAEEKAPQPTYQPTPYIGSGGGGGVGSGDANKGSSKHQSKDSVEDRFQDSSSSSSVVFFHDSLPSENTDAYADSMAKNVSTDEEMFSIFAFRESVPPVSFWADGASGCKSQGKHCWLGNECCSGICRRHRDGDSDGTEAGAAVCFSSNPTTVFRTMVDEAIDASTVKQASSTKGAGTRRKHSGG